MNLQMVVTYIGVDFFCDGTHQKNRQTSRQTGISDLPDTDRACNGTMFDDSMDRLGVSNCSRWNISKRRIVYFCIVIAVSV